jgi:hypothetical protein
VTGVVVGAAGLFDGQRGCVLNELI